MTGHDHHEGVGKDGYDGVDAALSNDTWLLIEDFVNNISIAVG